MNLVDRDPWLAPFRSVLERREHHYGTTLHEIEQQGGLLGPISQGYRYFGLNPVEGGVMYREWAPGAEALSLIGEFNFWDREADPMVRDEFGVWSVFVSGERLRHGGKVKVHVRSAIGAMDRVPAYARRVVQEPNGDYVAVYWNPETQRREEAGSLTQRRKERKDRLTQRREGRKDGLVSDHQGLRIYEAHVGMATEEGRVGTFREFRESVLPRIERLGYNAVQLMAVQEHPYYGSFGYHVSSFYAVSSRFGTPEELKELIDAAHGLGLRVFLDLVHSHSVKNTHEGLYLMDGTSHQYFHEGARGVHSAWDSMLFDYSKYEVRRFLLSNVRYWLEEFRFDGFRFDGVTSMLYHHHGLCDGFASLDAYFGGDVDDDALLYLKLANQVAHAVNPEAVTIAEDVSGMPGIARPVEEWGVGFDYRLAMGAPDYWFKLVSKVPDEDWRLGGIYEMLLNRRRDERHISYVESHDQALVGDKTLAFWLMDAEMYSNMANDRQSLVIDRGIALHKMIRLATFSIGGEGYLNFMGNEFGHPEWIDFPREGNGYSYHYARRQWSLADNGFLRYQGLDRFDEAMQALDIHFGLLTDPLIEQLAVHEDTRQLVYRRGPLIFAFNFHPTESFEGLRIPIPVREDHLLLLSTDEERFRGHGRVETMVGHPWLDEPMYGRDQSMRIYLPSRSASVYVPQSLSAAAEAFRIATCDKK